MFSVQRPFSRNVPVFLLAIVGLLTFHSASALSESGYDYSPPELEKLVGPVALYPDDLLGIILPASSYPLQIVQAARYLEAFANNPDLKPDDDWDDAVVALLNYPQVIELLNEDLDWTWNLGAAVVNQQPAVLDAIQDFRGRAVAAGNLETDGRQIVRQVDEVIEITPVNPEEIYLPYYEPDRVVVHQNRPVYRYYADAYPLYYYPYPSYHPFTSGFFWGVTTAYSVGWWTDRLHVHYYGHTSHPYYGRHYTGYYKARRAGRVRHRHYTDTSRRHRYGNTWKPRQRHGNRPPHDRSRAEHRDRVAVNSSGLARRHNRSGGKRNTSSENERYQGSNRRTKRIMEGTGRARGTRYAQRGNESTAANRKTTNRAQSSHGKHKKRQSVGSTRRSAPKSSFRQKSVATPPVRPPRGSREARSTRERESSRGVQQGKRRSK